MIKDLTLDASPRDGMGKGFARRLRMQGLIPAAVYGEGIDPVAVSVNAKALAAILRSPLGGISDNGLFALRCAPWVDEEGEPARLHRRNLLSALRRHRDIKFIDQQDRAALDRLAPWLEAMIARRNRYGIADLLRYAVSSSEFLAIIARGSGGGLPNT